MVRNKSQPLISFLERLHPYGWRFGAFLSFIFVALLYQDVLDWGMLDQFLSVFLFAMVVSIAPLIALILKVARVTRDSISFSNLLCFVCLVSIYLVFTGYEIVSRVDESVGINIVIAYMYVSLFYGASDIICFIRNRFFYLEKVDPAGGDLVYLPLRWVWRDHFFCSLFGMMAYYAFAYDHKREEGEYPHYVLALVFLFIQTMVHRYAIENSKVDLHPEGIVIDSRLRKWSQTRFRLERKLWWRCLNQTSFRIHMGILWWSFSPYVPDSKVEELQCLIDNNQQPDPLSQSLEELHNAIDELERLSEEYNESTEQK